jgi:pimeloyl-ACP methyl ester carboxylesterase
MLNYTIYNQDKINHTSCLVFLHGYTGTLETWSNTYSYFTQDENLKNFPVIFIDNLGSGKSPQPEGKYTTELMSEKILEILDDLQIKNMILIGHSLGGAIAQQIAISRPNFVNQLFLISSFANVDAVCSQFLSSRYELMLAGVSKELIAKVSIPTIFANKYIQSGNNLEIAINRVINNPQGLNGMYGQLTACLEHNTLDTLYKIISNTVIITGDNDLLVNKKHSELLYQLIIKSEIIYLSNCGHMVQLEETNQLFNILKEYIPQKKVV